MFLNVRRNKNFGRTETVDFFIACIP